MTATAQVLGVDLVQKQGTSRLLDLVAVKRISGVRVGGSQNDKNKKTKRREPHEGKKQPDSIPALR